MYYVVVVNVRKILANVKMFSSSEQYSLDNDEKLFLRGAIWLLFRGAGKG